MPDPVFNIEVWPVLEEEEEEPPPPPYVEKLRTTPDGVCKRSVTGIKIQDVGHFKRVVHCVGAYEQQDKSVSRMHHADYRDRGNCMLMLAFNLCYYAPPPSVDMYHVWRKLAQSLNVGQHHRRRANINPALDQSIVLVLLDATQPTIDPAMCRCNVH